MKHNSVKLDSPVEFINIQPLNPLISKCQIKVCYVSDEPNRNRSIITKETAKEMANSLPGSPIVGFYNEAKQDFEEHNRIIDLSNGEFKIKDTTRPYGFVDMNARVWFQKFADDGVEHEYMMTEGYLWTGQYPECQRIIDHGNNQSMELDENSLDATWTKDEKGNPKFFIINEAIISKLCILGEENEPCFEGSQITNVQFSFEDGFKTQLFSMMNELKELLQEGGAKQVFNTYAVEIGDALWSALYEYIEKTYPDTQNGWCSVYRVDGIFEESGQKFAILQNRVDMKYYRMNFSVTEQTGFQAMAELVEVTKTYVPAAEPQFSAEAVEAFESEYAKKKAKKDEEEDKEKPADEGSSDSSKDEEPKDGEDKEDKGEKSDKSDNKDDEEEDPEKKKKKKYSLEEIPEYIDLQAKYSALEQKVADLEAEKKALEDQIAPLAEFKLTAERAEKETLINSFYMLTDEDKKNVLENIDTYSLKDIEAELSIICVRKRVSFADESESEKPGATTFNLTDTEEDESTPAWVKAALSVAKSMN